MKNRIKRSLTLILALISLISGRGIAMCRAETVETPLYILLEDAESEDLEVEYTHETDYGTKVPGYGTDNHGNRYGDVYYSNGESYWADLSLDGAYTEFAGTVFVQERIPMVGKSSGSAAFTVYADGKQIFSVNGFDGDMEPVSFRLDVRNVKVPTIETSDNGVTWPMGIGYMPGLVLGEAVLRK